MADLHKKLAMRRKGISGNLVNEAQKTTTATTPTLSGPSIMGSISSMIPPPKGDDSNGENSNDEEDWD